MTTRTEERLADALAARAAAVRADSLRPLRARPERRRARAWRWLVPLAAAMSVALVAGLMAALGPGPPPLAARGLPRYYVWYASSTVPARLQVRSTSTGAVVASVPDPALASGGGWEWVGAQAGLRTYVALAACGHCRRSRVYSFHLERGGRVTGMAVITDRTMPVRAVYSLSPDGSRLGYLMSTVLKGRLTTRIVIFSLRTGRVAVFRGGLGRRGFVPVVRSLSWPRNGKYLAFAVTLCPRSGPPGSTCSPWTVRSLNPAARGGSLASGSVLLTTHAPVVMNQVINPLVINPAGTGALRMSVQPPRSTANQTFRLTSISLTTGERTVLRTWVGPDIEALYATGGVVLVLSAPGRVGQFPSHRFRVIGLIGRSGKYQPLPFDRAGD